MLNELRPLSFNKFIGQINIKKTLKIMISSANKRKVSLDHILLTGKPGMGKTTIANLIAKEMNVNIRFSQGANLDKKSDLLALLGVIKKNDVVFIDEIHSLNKNIEELLYNIMEDSYVDIVIGPDGDSKIVRLKIPNFCLIGATTKIDMISKPLHDRFGIIFQMKDYATSELKTIAKNSFGKLKFKVDEPSKIILANSCLGNPRILNNFIKRIIDFATVNEKDKIDEKLVNKTFNSIGIYENGLNESHIDYLKLLHLNAKGSYISLNNIADILKVSRQNVEKIIESDLIYLSLINKNSRGRKISELGIKYLLKNKLL